MIDINKIEKYLTETLNALKLMIFDCANMLDSINHEKKFSKNRVI